MPKNGGWPTGAGRPLKSQFPTDADHRFSPKKLKQFDQLTKPLSAQLIANWPPKDRVLTFS